MSDNEAANGVMTPRRASSALVVVQNSPARPQPPQQVAPRQHQVGPRQHQVAQPQQQVKHTMCLVFKDDGTAVLRPAPGSYLPGGGASAAGEGSSSAGLQPKKRGRPRRYGPDGAIALSPSGLMLSPPPVAPLTTIPQVQVPPPSQAAPPPTTAAGLASPPPSQAAPLPTTAAGLASPPPSNKRRGRPPGSSNRRQQPQPQQQQQQTGAMGLADFEFMTPHVLSILPGEDLSSKIMLLTQQGRRDICIMSANGFISSATLRQPAISGGTVTYEGRFEILSLSGSFLLTEVGGERTRTGGLSVTLSGHNGRILGGSVAGLLTAASPVKLVLGSFPANGLKETKPVNIVDPSSAPPRAYPGGAPGASSLPPHGNPGESSGGSGIPLVLPTGCGCKSNGQGMSSMPWK